MDKGISTEKGVSSTPGLIREPWFHVIPDILLDFSACLSAVSEVLHFRKTDARFILGHAQFHSFLLHSLSSLVAKLGEPANWAGSVFQGTVERIIYVHYKNNWFSKYPSCGALLAHCSNFIMNNELKILFCKAALKCPFGETAGTGTAGWIHPKKWTLQHSSESHVFLHFLRVLSFISWACFSVWFDWVPGRGASANAAPFLSWLSQNEAIWGRGPAVSVLLQPLTTGGWSKCDLSQVPGWESAGQESPSLSQWRDWIQHLPAEAQAVGNRQGARSGCFEGDNASAVQCLEKSGHCFWFWNRWRVLRSKTSMDFSKEGFP